MSTLRSGSQLVVGSTFLQVGIFGAGLLVARSEGPRSFGLYSAAFALGSAIVGGATAGLPLLVLRRASVEDLDHGVLRRAARLQLALVLPAVMTTALIGAAVLGGANGAVAGGAGGLLFAIINVTRLGQNVHSGRRQYRRAAAADVVAGTLFPVLTYRRPRGRHGNRWVARGHVDRVGYRRLCRLDTSAQPEVRSSRVTAAAA